MRRYGEARKALAGRVYQNRYDYHGFSSCGELEDSDTLIPIPNSMGAHMKTTIEISDVLLKDAKRLAARDGVTLRTLVESGLRHEIAQRKHPAAFRLRKATFRGNGLQPGARELPWDQLRELAYTGRGA